MQNIQISVANLITNMVLYIYIYIYIYILCELRGKVDVLRGESISHCEKKKIHMSMCLILNGYRVRSV